MSFLYRILDILNNLLSNCKINFSDKQVLFYTSVLFAVLLAKLLKSYHSETRGKVTYSRYDRYPDTSCGQMLKVNPFWTFTQRYDLSDALTRRLSDYIRNLVLTNRNAYIKVTNDMRLIYLVTNHTIAYMKFLMPFDRDSGVRSTEYAVRSTEYAVRSTEYSSYN